jgi:DNA (cytosine-5)-methyltransferase 1
LAVEIDKRRCEVLRQRASEGWFPKLKVECCDVRDFDASPWTGRVDCIAAGFPCQDISSAGKGAGIRGKRSGLFFVLLKIIDVIKPSIIFLENSPLIRTRGRRVVIRQFVARGYAWRDGTLAASHVGAGHIRNRWWLLAADAHGRKKLQHSPRLDIGSDTDWQYPESQSGRFDQHGGDRRVPSRSADAHQVRRKKRPKYDLCRRKPLSSGSNESTADAFTAVADAFRNRLQVAVRRGGLSETDAKAIEAAARYCTAFHWSPPDVGVCRVVDGIAHRMDRIATCGDGQVPLAAAAAWLLLASQGVTVNGRELNGGIYSEFSETDQ